MLFRLNHDESAARGLRRVAREEIDSAVAHLRVKVASRRDESVHEARKSIKKLRGLVRLLAPELGDSGKHENMALRDLGRTLSSVRDAAAMVETVDLLGKKYPDNPAFPKLTQLRLAMVRQRNAIRRQASAAPDAEKGVLVLRSLRRQLNQWNIGADFQTLAPGLRVTYRRGRRAAGRAKKNPNARNLHELRKRVKDYWYQVRLLESMWPKEDSPENSLRELQEKLGDAHNLAVLRDRPEAIVGGVIELINELEKDLREKALEAAEKLYGERPRAHVKRLDELWRAWRAPEPERRNVRAAAAAASAVQATSAA
ncbi:MAG TPA: CHAD domain-containing protein [Bryobacteraceae bacterium]|nr:CHAD domain-containing protein [Bryobacteraceae bacterium]